MTKNTITLNLRLRANFAHNRIKNEYLEFYKMKNYFLTSFLTNYRLYFFFTAFLDDISKGVINLSKKVLQLFLDQRTAKL